MIVGIGVDICRVSRIAALRERYGARFLNRAFTAGEQARCGLGPGCDQRYAARFAAKEAALKALGTGLARGLTLKDAEVTNSADGQPGLQLHGRAAVLAHERGVTTTHLSLSHEDEYAIAYVILETGAADAPDHAPV